MLKGLLQSLLGTSAEVPIGFSVDDERQSLCQFLKALRPIIQLGHGKRWALDLTECTYLGPYAATVILATSLEAERKEQSFKIKFPDNSPKIDAFRQFSGLNHWLYDGPLPDQNHPRCVTVPLRQVMQSTFADAGLVLGLVKRHVSLGEDEETYLGNAVYETLQNVEDHAGSPIGAIFCARFIEDRHKIRIAIMDRGDGVFTTLRRGHPDTISAEMAVSRVIRGGYSAKSRQSNMGVGVSNLWRFMAQILRGDICIVSENCIAYNIKRDGTARYEDLGYRFPGTGVFFNVPVTDKRR